MHLQFRNLTSREQTEMREVADAMGKEAAPLDEFTIAFQRQGTFTICVLKETEHEFASASKCALKYDRYRRDTGEGVALAKTARQWAGFALENNGKISRGKKNRIKSTA